MIDEFTKKPEDLTPEKLQQAKGLASIITGIRKGAYFIFYLLSSIVILGFIHGTIPLLAEYCAMIILLIFMLFKFRDLIRGTI